MEKTTARRWDWLTAILVFLLLQVTAARLVTTDWADHLYFGETLAAFGAMLGLAIGASRFKRRVAIWLTIGYTVLIVPWQISAASQEKLLLERLQEVGGILVVSAVQFWTRKPVKDPLFFVAIVCLAFWLLSVAAGYWAARHRNVMAGILPSGIVMVVIQVYANYQLHGSWWLGVYLLIALLLIGRMYYLESEKGWSERRVYVNDEAWPNILGGLFAAVAVTILIAWAFPTSISSVQGATDAWTRMTRSMRDRLANAVSSLNGPYGRPGLNFYGAALALGQEAAQGDSPVFTVEVLKNPESVLRYYWRGRVYDTYQSGQWTISPSPTLDFNPASGDLRVADIEGRTQAQLRFTLQLPTQSLLYAPSEPEWVSRPASVDFTPVELGLHDVLAWQAKQALTNGDRYEVRSEVGNPSVEQLRSAIVVYPKWIYDRYLQVPDSLRPQFEALAQKVTEGRTTPYDKAVAITSYLRANLKYSTSVPAAPEGKDPVQWVLFDYKQGFCNYYASAEVLMLRSVGVPARLAVGFAQGEYQNGKYTVRRRDAHAWPEVFFPGWGWMAFEPTASQQPLVRLDPSAIANPGPSGPSERKPLEEQFPNEPTVPIKPEPLRPVSLTQSETGRILIAMYSLFALGLAFYLLHRFGVLRRAPAALARAYESSGLSTPRWIEMWLRWSRLDPVEQAFASINWSLMWFGDPPALDATAAERASALKNILPSAAEQIGIVASELETGLFTPGPADLRRARRAGLLVLLYALRARLQRFLGVGEASDVYVR